MAHVKPGEAGEIIWQFSKAGEYVFACLMPGHLEAGMAGGGSAMKPRLEKSHMKPLLVFATLVCAASTAVHGRIPAAAVPPQAATSVPAFLR